MHAADTMSKMNDRSHNSLFFLCEVKAQRQPFFHQWSKAVHCLQNAMRVKIRDRFKVNHVAEKITFPRDEAGELSQVPRILVKWFLKWQPQQFAEGNEMYVLHRTSIFNQETYRRSANQNLDSAYGQKEEEEKTTSRTN